MSKPKVFIQIEGGIIHCVVADQEVEVTFIDFDTDGVEEDYIKDFFGHDAYIVQHEIDVNPDRVINIEEEIERGREEDENDIL